MHINQLKIGTRVFSIHHSDGKAHPTHYLLEYEGNVIRISETLIWIQHNDSPIGHAESNFSKGLNIADKNRIVPSIDGFCYYMAELPEIEQYKDGDLYKVPTSILKAHMKTYKSPWEG
jgi:hypothetical protein